MPMEQLTFKLAVFEGPLDLLLHLLSRHKLEIRDIPISELLEQYLEWIERMKAADLEIASEFLAMAARLVYIKTASLLPSYEGEGEQLRQELEGQLLEYRLCKEMAERLRQRNVGGQLFIRDPLELPVDKTYRLEHPAQLLLDAYLQAAGRARRKMPPPRTAFSGIVSRRMVTVESRIVYVLGRLYRESRVSYEEFFAAGDHSEQVATFLALLELIKSGRIRISDDDRYVFFAPGKRTETTDGIRITADGPADTGNEE